MINQVYSISDWKTFHQKNQLYAIEIPSNWYADKVGPDEKAAQIDELFRYKTPTSWAFVNILFDNETLYDNPKDALEGDISEDQAYDHYKIINPIECEKYSINQLKSCSAVISYKMDDEDEIRNELEVVAFTKTGTQITIIFAYSQNLNDFAPIGDRMIQSFKFDESKLVHLIKINESLELNSSKSGNELNSIPETNSEQIESDIKSKDAELENDLEKEKLQDTENNKPKTIYVDIPEGSSDQPKDIKKSTSSIKKGIPADECLENLVCYVPWHVNINRGDKVVWTDNDITVHTVTSGKYSSKSGLKFDGKFDSGIMSSGKTFEFTFDEQGTFEYMCTLHPWMIGKVTVE